MHSTSLRSLIKPIGLLLALLLVASPTRSSAFFNISIDLAPPPLPVYVQPPCPYDGYIWTPGYWDYSDEGYFWVPGVWVEPPRFGLLWTPGYWGYNGGFYAWHGGYWGSQVGYYGGIDYGFGYPGRGFYGGNWQGNRFRYNTAVVNVNRTVVHNTYIDRRGGNNSNGSRRASFNGRGGVNATPSTEERSAMRESHLAPTSNQTAHQAAARQDRSQFASVNHGKPQVSAMNRVDGRRFNQQGRIANGIASGQLTPNETRHLENRETKIDQTVRIDRQANGGSLPQPERHAINQRQDNLNNSLSADKHNAAMQHEGARNRSADRVANGGGHPNAQQGHDNRQQNRGGQQQGNHQKHDDGHDRKK